jgi:hypothetical protein
MQGSVSAVFMSGVIVGVVLLTTILVVPLFRYLVLVAATVMIAAIYLHGGVPELAVYASSGELEVAREPIFSAGVFAGGMMVTLVRFWKRRIAR